jgi:putative nucleotidyltransferase with HDIG domain
MQEQLQGTERGRHADLSAEQLRRALDAAQAELTVARRRLTRQQTQLERQRSRAEAFRGALKQMQRASFHGNVYHLVLESCVALTDSSIGVYVADEGRGLRVKASIGGDARPNGAPSSFMSALATRVLDLDDAVVCGDADTRDLPRPSETEQFETCAAVPVAVRGALHGVVIVAGKRNENYSETDLETLLHVGDQAGVAVDNARLQHELEEAYIGTVAMLADAVETKDPYTRGHCQQVSKLARLVAAELGLDPEARQTVCLAALLHDIGKIGVSDSILNKPGPLQPEERDLLRSHVRIGSDLMRGHPALRVVAQLVLHHHEWYDGTGYPDGLAGDAIPIGSRIVAVVDSYCAMVDRRSYKQAASDAEAREELRRCAGTQFDPALVDVFLRVLDSDAMEESEESASCGVLPTMPRSRGVH